MASSKLFKLLALPDNPPRVVGDSPVKERLDALADRVERYRSLPASEAELIQRLQGADAVISSRVAARFPRQALVACPQLKIIARLGAGVDHIDLAAAQELGITVCNTPSYGAPYVAEHALALALAVSRQIVTNDQHIRNGGWTRGFINELYHKTLGVVGTGAIGQRMIQLGQGIGMKVVAWTLHPSAQRAAQYGVEFLALEELLQQSDVVSIHLELSDLTRHLIGRHQFALMKPSTILINTARGAVVDQIALIEALKQRRIAGAGLDVFEQEPLPGGHQLTRLDNVVLSPHVASISYRSVLRCAEMTVENLEAFGAGKPANVVVSGNS